MGTENDNETEIKSWLKVILKKENLQDFSIKVVGTSSKGDGYMGDIVFVDVNGITQDGDTKEYNLVLKCAKRSAAFREKSPVKEAFYNEIFFYNTIFPRFLQFQNEKNVDEPFDKVPKCYGTLIKGEMEVLALENLKKKGYILWDRKTPLTRRHIDMVVKGYATFHAISIAMEREQPQEFRQMAEVNANVMAKFLESTDMLNVFEATVEETYSLLKNDLEEELLLKWRNLRNYVRPIFSLVNQKLPGLNVITHGDCWNNNFMHYHNDNEPVTFAMLDWQVSRYTSPMLDLSYFLFSCISKEDINDLEVILEDYHKSLINHLGKLGVTNPERVYPLEQVLNEWRKYCKYGILTAQVIHKFSLSENDEVIDMVQAAESDEGLAQTFLKPVKNLEGFKKRMSYIVKYVVEHNLV